MLYIVLIAAAVFCVATIVLAVTTLKRLDDLRSYLNTLECDIRTVTNKVECVDFNIHTLVKNQEEYHKTFLNIEKEKTLALDAIRKKNDIDHKVIADGVEERYQMVYEEFRQIKELLNAPHECCCNSDDKTSSPPTPTGEKIMLAKQLKEAGKTVKEIAAQLGVAESTVRGYLKKPGLISPDEEDPLGMPQIDDPAAYHKFVHKVVDEKLNGATDGKTIDWCPFSATHGTCDVACSDACIDCIQSARAFNLQD